MSGELDAAGALATAGLAAGAIEGREGGAAGEGACLNCGAALTGPYCAQCGQHAHPHRTFVHVFEEFLHGIVHFDTKAWRTLPLLAFRPGTLTRSYVYGKRARYISPLALFLFMIFLMFFVFAVQPDLLQAGGVGQGPSAEALSEAQAQLSESEAELAERRAEGDTGADIDLAEGAVRVSRARVEAAQRELAAEAAPPPPQAGVTLRVGNGETAAPQAEGDAITLESPATWQSEVREIGEGGRIDTGIAALDARINHSLENPDLALYKIKQAAYKFSFLLVPISLPFVWLLFLWKKGVTLYDHVVFTLYSLSFVALLAVAVSLASQTRWTEWIGDIAVFLGLPAHMFFHLKGAYALGWFSALWRTLVLIVFALASLLIFLFAIVMLGLAG